MCFFLLKYNKPKYVALSDFVTFSSQVFFSMYSGIFPQSQNKYRRFYDIFFSDLLLFSPTEKSILELFPEYERKKNL